MFHSIIIPHRDRNRQLHQCVWSIERSARASGIPRDKYEILVVDHCSDQYPVLPDTAWIVNCRDPYGVLNKNRLLNLGIEEAVGCILSFLDADMLVGRLWMGATRRALTSNRPPTRLAYRVRQLKIDDNAHQNPELVLGQLKDQRFSSPEEKEAFLDGWFAEYERFTRGFEAYGRPDAGWHPITGDPRIDWPVFGNSQFSIRRDVLGDLRFDESFSGAGYEDIHMAWAIQEQAGQDYRGEILTGSEYALFHIWHGPRVETDLSFWAPGGVSDRNRERYERMMAR